MHPPGHDFLTVLGAHEGEGLLVEHDATVSSCGSTYDVQLLCVTGLPLNPTGCLTAFSPALPHCSQVAGSRSADTKGQRADHRIVEVGAATWYHGDRGQMLEKA